MKEYLDKGVWRQFLFLILFLSFCSITSIQIYYRLGLGIGYIHTNYFPHFIFLIQIICMLSVILSMVLNKKNRFMYNKKNLFIFLSFIFLMVIMNIIIIFNHDVYGPTRSSTVSAIGYNWPIIVSSITLFFLGSNFDKILICKKGIFALYIFSSVNVLMFSTIETLGFNRELFLNIEFWNNYLVIADAFSLLALVTLSLVDKRFKFFVFSFSLLIVFLIGSRTSLYLFFLCGVLLLRYLNIIKNGYIVLFACLGVILIVVFGGYIYEYLLETNSRMFFFLSNSKDGSLSGRDMLLHQGLESIYSNWLFGDFAGQLYKQGDLGGARWGAYIHNFLSYWRQFGLVAFLLYALLLILSLREIVKIYLEKKSMVFYQAFFTLGVFFLFESLFFRSYSSAYPFLIFGMLSSNYWSAGTKMVYS